MKTRKRISSRRLWSALRARVGLRHFGGSITILTVFVLVAFGWAVWEKSSSATQLDSLVKLIDNPGAVTAEAGRGVVGLWALRKQTGETGLIGCGVTVDSRGFILTSSKLITGLESLHIIDSENIEFEATVISTDDRSGLALLHATPGRPEGFESIRMGDSSAIGEGDGVLALGGRIDPSSWVLTSKPGRVTKARQSLRVEGVRYRDLIQTDIHLTSENLGAPLVNSRGEVIGLCLPAVQPPEMSASTSYALPVNQAKEFLRGLPIPRWSQGPNGKVINWLGVEMVPLGAQFIGEFSGPTDGSGGRIINFVKNNSPSDRAGLRRGDVVTHIDGNRLYGDAFFDDAAAQWCQASRIKLSVLRDGKVKQITVRIKEVGYSAPREGSLAEVVLVVLILTLIYYLVYKNVLDRVVLFVLGSLGMALVGQYLGFYSESQISAALLSKLDVLCFLVGMQLVTGILEEAGALEYLGKKIAVVTGGDKWWILLLFTLVTYCFSTVMNNLTTIILVAPMVLRLSRHLDYDPKPFLISMIIASNLGGASTMIGDFPNMLISAEAGLSFSQFATYMLPICLLELFVVLIYMRIVRHSDFGRASIWKTTKKKLQAAKVAGDYQDCESWLNDIPELIDSKDHDRRAFLNEMRRSLRGTVTNRAAVKKGMIILALVVIGFFFADLVGWSPAIVALVGGVTALAFGGCDPLSLLTKIGIKDILFFAGLFVLVGAAEASGSLVYVSKMLVQLSFGNLLVLSLLLMWMGALATCFMNAGPTTAMFLPIVLSLETAAPHCLYWWALSLGVCAGSSGTLAGATAGSVTATMLDRFMDDKDVGLASRSVFSRKKNDPTTKLTFREYSALGVPVMIILLVMSSVYVALIYGL